MSTLPKARPGPKPRGRRVVPLGIALTFAQRATLEEAVAHVATLEKAHAARRARIVGHITR